MTARAGPRMAGAAGGRRGSPSSGGGVSPPAGAASTDPLAAVCYPAAPPWFNRFYAHFQLRTVARMLGDLPLRGARALDVGCGSGRWTRWLAERGAEPVGIDPTAAMLETARRL